MYSRDIMFPLDTSHPRTISAAARSRTTRLMVLASAVTQTLLAATQSCADFTLRLLARRAPSHPRDWARAIKYVSVNPAGYQPAQRPERQPSEYG